MAYNSPYLGAVWSLWAALRVQEQSCFRKRLHPETAGPVGGEVLGKACLNCPGLACLCLSLTSHLSYGAPGVEFTGLHRDAATVTQMHFLPGQVNICPPPAAGGPHSHVLLPSRPTPFWSLLLPCQGRLLTLLDDSSLHLWEIIHHNGCAHLEEGLSFQPPSRPSFDNARY